MKFDQIRRVRKAAHVTQEELAKRIGVNRALISKYETGIIEPSVSQLQKIASALGVPMMELLDLEEGAERIKRDENLIRKLSYEFDIPKRNLQEDGRQTKAVIQRLTLCAN